MKCEDCKKPIIPKICIICRSAPRRNTETQKWLCCKPCSKSVPTPRFNMLVVERVSEI